MFQVIITVTENVLIFSLSFIIIILVARDETTHPEEDNSCCLCDNVINVQLSPCGHSVMCSHHAGMAKRCPECNVSILYI